MSMQDQTVEREARLGRFKIGITAPIIDQIPSTGSVEKLLNDQGLHAARTH
jgi:hypothetical protein